MNEAKAFSDYVNTLRAKNQISLQDLCRGLCTHQELSYLETGTRQLDMLLEDAILERLGVGAEGQNQTIRRNKSTGQSQLFNQGKLPKQGIQNKASLLLKY